MKRVLIYANSGLDADELDTLRALARRILQLPGELDLRILSDAPVCLRREGDAGVSQLHLSKLGVAGNPSAQHTCRGAELEARTRIIRRALAQFNPDLVLVDGLPYGQYDELAPILATPWPVQIGPQWVLLLRDLLGCGEPAARLWRKRGYFEAIAKHYKQVLVLGERRVFDLEREYQVPAAAAEKFSYCGYFAPEPGRSVPGRLRRALGVANSERLVVVTAGAGADGEALIRNVLAGLRARPAALRPRCHIVYGEQMRESERLAAACLIHGMPSVSLQHGSRDMMSLIAAADVVVANASYHKICEVLALRRRTVVVPGETDAKEQTMRARRMEELGLIRMVPAHACTPRALLEAICTEVLAAASQRLTAWRPTTDSIEFITSTVGDLLDLEPECVTDARALRSARKARQRAPPSVGLPLRNLVESDPRISGLR